MRKRQWMKKIGIVLSCCFLMTETVIADGVSCMVDDTETEMILEYCSDNETSLRVLGIDDYQPGNVLVEKTKLVNLVKADLITQYKESGTIQSWKSDLWHYKVIVEKENLFYILSLLKKDESVELIEATVDVSADDPILQKYFVGNDEIERILRENGVDRQSILSEEWMLAQMYRTLFFAFTTETGEFLIPYTDMWGGDNQPILENGRVYTPEEVVEALAVLEMEGINSDEQLYGGVGRVESVRASENKKTSELNTIWIVVFSAGALVAVSILVVIGRKKLYA